MTNIKFIGLFVLMYTQGIGYHILFPHFVMPTAPHPSIIAFRAVDYAGGDWQPVKDIYIAPTSGINCTVEPRPPECVAYKYVLVHKQNITLLNSTGGTPPAIDFPLPHLTCCCPAFADGFLPDYGNPNEPAASKKSAHVYVNNASTVSQFTTYFGALNTKFGVPTSTTTGLTIQGTIGGSVNTVILKPDAEVIFSNTPLAVLEGGWHGGADDDHFRAYYKMGKKTQNCKALPSDGGGCAPKTACPTLDPKMKSASPKTTKSATAAASHALHDVDAMIDVDCSNSQYP